MVEIAGLEPAYTSVFSRALSQLSYISKVRIAGVEPASQLYQNWILPLEDTRAKSVEGFAPTFSRFADEHYTIQSHRQKVTMGFAPTSSGLQDRCFSNQASQP